MREDEVKAAHDRMYRAMLAADVAGLGRLLDADYTLTHMTGYRQPKAEWLRSITTGEMRYHAVQQKSVKVEASGQEATLVDRSVVTATIYGTRRPWNLQLTTRFVVRHGEWVARETVAASF